MAKIDTMAMLADHERTYQARCGTFHNLTGEEADAVIRQYDDKTLHLGLNEDWDQKGHK